MFLKNDDVSQTLSVLWPKAGCLNALLPSKEREYVPADFST